MNKHLLILAVVVGFVVVLYSTYTDSKQQQLNLEQYLESQGGGEDTFRIEDVPGVTNVERFSDPPNKKDSTKINGSGANNTEGANHTERNIAPVRTPKPLPYPRITINYSVYSVDSLNGQIAGDKEKFVVASTEIRNYGYKYFDAYPTKFNLKINNEVIEPTINASTGNMLDAVLPNNSVTIGDLIFKVNSKYRINSRSSILIYKDGNYLIMYNK